MPDAAHTARCSNSLLQLIIVFCLSLFLLDIAIWHSLLATFYVSASTLLFSMCISVLFWLGALVTVMLLPCFFFECPHFAVVVCMLAVFCFDFLFPTMAALFHYGVATLDTFITKVAIWMWRTVKLKSAALLIWSDLNNNWHMILIWSNDDPYWPWDKSVQI